MHAVLFQLFDTVFQALYFLLMIRVLLSWIPTNNSHPIVRMIYEITDPMLRPFQDIVPAYKIGIDLSPLFAFIALELLRKLLFQLLF